MEQWMGGKRSPCIVTFNHGTMRLDTGGEERRVDSRNEIYYYDCKLVRLIRLMDEILHQHLEIELGQISASPLPPSSMLGVFCH